MSWAEIKKSINSTLGTLNDKPLNDLVNEESYRNMYETALLFKKLGLDQNDAMHHMGFDYYIGYPTTSAFHPFDETSKHIFVENGFKKIRDNYLAGSSISSIYMPPSIVEIGQSAFDRSEMLTSVNWSDNIKKISPAAFRGCSFRAFLSPSKLELIGAYGFALNNNMTNAIIRTNANNLTIQDAAFYNCTNLDTVYIIVKNGTNLSISNDAYFGCEILMNIYLSCSPQEVSGAPWGAVEAPVHYNINEVIE